MRWLTPLVHPAAIMRGKWNLEPAQKAYLQRVAKDPNPVLVDVSQPPPGCNPNPSLEDLREFVEMRSCFWGISFDIENAGPHLVCCGVMYLTKDLEPSYGACFRFRHKGGAPWWPWDQHLTAVELLDILLKDPNLVKAGHFIVQHDIPLLTDIGFEVAGPVLDTSVLLHAVHSEFPKGLQWAATLFAGAPRWKDVPDEKEAEPEGDDA